MSQVYSIEKLFTTATLSLLSKDDNLYQEVLDYIRGINSNKESMVEGSISKKLLEEESKYSKVNKYKFGLLTWNMAGKNITDEIDLDSTLLSYNTKFNEPADIYFVGFQETRKLNAFAILQGANKAKVGK